MLIIKPATVQSTSEACILVGTGTNSIPGPCSLMPPICSLSIYCADELMG